MGFIKQIVGEDLYDPLDIFGGKKEKAAKEAADRQSEAIRASASQAAKQSTEAAAQSARQQESNAARNAAESAAADAQDKPIQNADVLLDEKPGASASATARKRRQTFGVGSANSGVNI